MNDFRSRARAQPTATLEIPYPESSQAWVT